MGPKRGILLSKFFPAKNPKITEKLAFCQNKKNHQKKTLMFPPLCPVPRSCEKCIQKSNTKKVESYEQGERFYDYQQIN